MATLRTTLACLTVLALSAGAASAQSTKIEVSPRLPTALDRIEVTVSGTTPCQGVTIDPVRVEEGRVVIPVLNVFSPICLPQPFYETVTLGPLPAGTWKLETTIDGQPAARRTVDVIPASTELFLHDQRFRVRVEWSTPDGALRGEAYGVPLSDDAGYLWFFEGKNPEILIKILDGRLVNGHWWVFISSNTNLEFKVYVGQRNQSNSFFDQEKLYVSPAGANKNFIDTTSFKDN
jgi:hypothetical protein